MERSETTRFIDRHGGRVHMYVSTGLAKTLSPLFEAFSPSPEPRAPSHLRPDLGG